MIKAFREFDILIYFPLFVTIYFFIPNIEFHGLILPGMILYFSIFFLSLLSILKNKRNIKFGELLIFPIFLIIFSEFFFGSNQLMDSLYFFKGALITVLILSALNQLDYKKIIQISLMLGIFIMSVYITLTLLVANSYFIEYVDIVFNWLFLDIKNISMIFIIVNILAAKKIAKKASIENFIFAFIAIIATTLLPMRATWLAVLIGLLVLLIITRNKLILLLLAFFIVSLSLVPNYFSIYSDHASSKEYPAQANYDFYKSLETKRIFNLEKLVDDTGKKGRLGIWETGFEMFKDNFFSGVGFGNYYANSEKYAIEELRDPLFKATPSHTPHNFIIQILSELGLVGLFIFLVSFKEILVKSFSYLKNLLSKDRKLENEIFLPIFLSISTFGSFHDILNYKFFWFSVVIIYMSSYTEKIRQ